MQKSYTLWVLMGFLAGTISGCATQPEPRPVESSFSAAQVEQASGGQPAIVLSRSYSEKREAGKPHFVSATVLPGSGMNVYDLVVHLPGKEPVHLLAGEPLALAKEPSRAGGGPIIAPYTSRLRGKPVSTASKEIEVELQDRKVRVPQDTNASAPSGLLRRMPMDRVEVATGSDFARATGVLDASDFNDRWVSGALFAITAALKNDSFVLTAIAKNTGDEALPLSLSWLPHFKIPSSKRQQARVRIPARPGSAHPYSSGVRLDRISFDEQAIELVTDGSGQSVAELTDPQSQLGIRIRSFSPEMQAFQLFSPANQNYVAIGPRFWGPTEYGFLNVKPGESVTYSVEITLFKP